MESANKIATGTIGETLEMSCVFLKILWSLNLDISLYFASMTSQFKSLNKCLQLTRGKSRVGGGWNDPITCALKLQPLLTIVLLSSTRSP